MTISFNNENAGETAHNPIIVGDDDDTGPDHFSEMIHRWRSPTPTYDPNVVWDVYLSVFTDTDSDAYDAYDASYEDTTE